MTWEKLFDKKFIDSEISDIDGKTDYYLNDMANEVLPLKRFISDIRKKDCEIITKFISSQQIANKEVILEIIKNYYK